MNFHFAFFLSIHTQKETEDDYADALIFGNATPTDRLGIASPIMVQNLLDRLPDYIKTTSVPSHFVDPLSKGIMTDPVMASVLRFDLYPLPPSPIFNLFVVF